MADIAGLIDKMKKERTVQAILTSPLAQFGTKTRQYLGSTILPEKVVAANMYTEEKIRFRSIIANASQRFSPIQLKDGALYGAWDVKLAESDQGSQITASDYEALLRLSGQSASMDGVAQITGALNTMVNIPLVEHNELMRWQAIVNAQVLGKGDNGFRYTVNYDNPAGHRAAVTNAWTVDTNDPFDDIYTMVRLLASKGLECGRIITSTRVVGIMAQNAKVASRTNRLVVAAGAIVAQPGNVGLAQINAALSADGLPPIEKYDLQYTTSTGTARFLPDTVMVFIAKTGRDVNLDLGETTGVEVLPDTLGYLGVGTPAGQTAPGRVAILQHFETKPPRIEMQGWQTSLPVVTEPEAIAVLTGI